MGSDTATTSLESATASPGSPLPRAVAAGTHLLALVTWIVGPLLVMWLARDEFVRENARNALNWQLTVGAICYLAGVLAVATVAVGDTLFVLWSSVLLVGALGASLLFAGVAAVRAVRGESWEYPLAIRVTESTTVSRAF